MIRLKALDKSTFAGGTQFSVHPEQARFVEADLHAFVRSWRDDHDLHCYLILDDERPVGFFALDFSLERHRAYVRESANCCVLRNYFIDQNEQGRGLARGSLALLPEFVRAGFPSTQKIYLTVNEKNLAARKAYEKSGFVELPDRYLGGSAGPQAVMLLTL